MPLSTKRQRFVDEYLIDHNATQAAIRAGYSERSAHTTGSDLLKVPEVAEEIAGRRRARVETTTKITNITTERIVLELARLAFADNRQGINPDGTIKPPSEWSDDFAATVSAMEFAPTKPLKRGGKPGPARISKLKFWDKNRAAEMLAKHFGMFVEKIELGGTVQVANLDLLKKLSPEERQQMRALLESAKARSEAPANQNGVDAPMIEGSVERKTAAPE